MRQVIMFTRVGDEEIHIGKCTHAQARIIEKRKHGKIESGKLFLNLRPVHLAAAKGMLEITAERDPNVSEAELRRRMEWLERLVGHVAQVELHQQGRSKTEWKVRLEKKPQARIRQEPTEEQQAAFEKSLGRISAYENPQPLTEEEQAIALQDIWGFEGWSDTRDTKELYQALNRMGWHFPWDESLNDPGRTDVRELPEYKEWVRELYEEGVEVL